MNGLPNVTEGQNTRRPRKFRVCKHKKVETSSFNHNYNFTPQKSTRFQRLEGIFDCIPLPSSATGTTFIRLKRHPSAAKNGASHESHIRHMAANRALRFPFKNPNTPVNSSRFSSSVSFSRTYAIGCSKIKRRIGCEIKNFENSYQWTVESVPGTDPFSSIKNSAPTSTSVQMAAASAAAATALELSSKSDARKICLFFCAETKILAEKIAAETDGIELRNISWRLVRLF